MKAAKPTKMTPVGLCANITHKKTQLAFSGIPQGGTPWATVAQSQSRASAGGRNRAVTCDNSSRTWRRPRAPRNEVRGTV